MTSDSDSSDFLDMSEGQEEDEEGAHSYDGPVLRNMTSELRSQAQVSDGDSWAIIANLAPSRKRKMSGDQPTATTKPVTTSTPTPRSTRERPPRVLTKLRMAKIKAFNNIICTSCGAPPFGGMGSEEWIAGLIGFMNDSRRYTVEPSDVHHWLQNAVDFFHEERKRIIWLYKSLPNDLPPESVGSVASATLPNPSSSVQETTAVGEEGDDLVEPDAPSDNDRSPPVAVASPSGGDDTPEGNTRETYFSVPIPDHVWDALNPEMNSDGGLPEVVPESEAPEGATSTNEMDMASNNPEGSWSALEELLRTEMQQIGIHPLTMNK